MYRIPRCWVCKDSETAVDVIKALQGRPDVEAKTKQWLGQSIIRAKAHLEIVDFSSSVFLASLGVEGLYPFVVISLCDDGAILVEYLVFCDDGQVVSRHEALDLIPELPTPEQIHDRCWRIRNGKPLSSYNDQWVGREGPAIREY